MTNVVNFNEYKEKKGVQENVKDMSQVHEIYISVIRYVYCYMQAELESPLEQIHPTHSLKELFDGNKSSLFMTLMELSSFWNVSMDDGIEYSGTNGIETDLFMIYPTVHSLCEKVEEKING